MAGTTLLDYITFNTFWKLTDNENEKSIDLIPIMSRYGKLIRTGAALLIPSGIGMMILTHGAFGEQLWFQIKFALVIFLTLNGMLVGNKQGINFRKAIMEGKPDFAEKTLYVRKKLKRFYVIQLAAFFSIIFLSVFKFT
jgi:hypothetical protein